MPLYDITIKVSYRLLVEDFSYSSVGVTLPQQKFEPYPDLIQLRVHIDFIGQAPWIYDDHIFFRGYFILL